MRYKDLHSIDVNSVEFKSLPADMRYDILTELKETRKQNSWGRVHEMPEELSDFSSFQMKRLLTRRSVQASLEEVEKEMGGRTLSLGDVEKMLKEGGVDVSANFGQRIASDNTTRFLYVNKQDENIVADPNKELNVNVTNSNSEIDYNETDMFYVDNDSSSDILMENVKTAKKLVAEHSDLTQEQILELIKEQSSALSFVQNLDAPSTSKQSETFCNEYTVKKEPTEKENKVSKKKKSKLMFNSNVSCESDLKMEIKKEDIDYSKNDKFVSSIPNSDTDKVIIDSKSNKSLSKIRADILKSLDEQLKELSSVSPIKIEVNIPTARVDDNKTKTNESMKISSLGSSKTDEMEHNHEKVSERDKDDLENNLKTSVTDKCLTDEIKPTLEFPTNKPLASEHNKTVQENEADFSGSSSDSNDLVDVQSCSSSVTEEPTEQPNLPSFQIEFKTTETCENDIFADVFNENKLTAFEVKENDEVPTSIDNTLFEKNKLFDNVLKSDNVNITEVKKSINSERLTLDNNCLTIDPDENITITSPYFEEKEQGIVVKSNANPTIKPPSKEKQENVNEDSQKQNHSKEMVSKKPKLTQNELLELKNELEVQEDSLKAKKGKEERTGATITEQMYIEAQELLHLFGVPYVIAPMEAEAQCAFLDSVGLTEGTITDDSDIWLFGGRQVYKNFFNQAKFVLQFKSDDIQHFFKLARAQLVLVALLVGSDYTVGLQGIGPVTALEILASFPPPSSFDGSNTTELLVSLEKFKEWMKSPPPTSLGKKLKDVQLLPGFPSTEVAKAYLFPAVDESMEPFSWGTPDLDALRDFAGRKFGWNQSKSDVVLLPVMKKLAEKNNQRTLDSFFRSVPNIQAHRQQMSARVQRAVHRIGGGSDEFETHVSQSRRTRGSTRSSPRVRNRGQSRSNLEIQTRINQDQSETDPPSPPVDSMVYKDELIPQREQDRLDALKRKMKAIEVMKKSKRGRGGKKRFVRQEKPEAKLSESSSDDEVVT